MCVGERELVRAERPWLCECVCVCPCRCEVSAGQSGVPPSAAHARLFSCLHRGRQQRSRGELEAVVTLCALGFGVLTLSVFFFFFLFSFFDKWICCRRGASVVERTPSPSVASQADSLLTVQSPITGYGK